MRKQLTAVALLIGAGLLLAGGTEPAPPVGSPGSIARQRAHYEKVLEELRTADASDLTASQQERRQEAIDRLQRYCESEDYPVNTIDPASNLPMYRDEHGRRCAVSMLLYEMDGAHISDHMAETDNHAFVSTLSGDPEFEAWLAESGLSLAETVRIMAPATTIGPTNDIGAADPNSSDPTETQEPTAPTVPETGGPTTGGGDPGGGPTTGGGGPGGPNTGGPGVNGGTPGGGNGPLGNGPGPGGSGPTAGGPSPGSGPLTGRGPRGGRGRETKSSLGADAWTLWFEFSKTEFYSPNELVLKGTPAGLTHDSTAEDRQDAMRLEMRRQVAPMLERAAQDEDPLVRAAAAAAIARTQGEAALPQLVGFLWDPDASVRERALLSLGATATPDARDILMSVARTGTFRNHEITYDARGLAHIALGIGAKRGMFDIAEPMKKMFAQYEERHDETLQMATIFHHHVSPPSKLRFAFNALHSDEEQPIAVRARSVELIPSITNDPKVAFEALQHYLNGKSLEMRRSAAVAMGSLDHELVLPQLTTAYELETEPVTRGFMLLSMARLGGDTARDFIAHELRKSKDKKMRPWVMLAAARIARERGDDELRELIRNKQLSNADRSARFVAMGIAGDESAIADLAKVAAEAKKPWDRARAAYGLALMETEEARQELRNVVWEEESTFVRVLQAFSLATYGAPEDAAFIVQAARETSDPDMIAACAVALRYHGTHDTLDLAIANAQDPNVSPIGRATLIEGIGMMLDTHRPLSTAAIWRQSNFGILPTWAAAAYRCTF